MNRTGSPLSSHRAFVGRTQSLRRSLPTGASARARSARLVTRDSLVLVPSGDGTSDHLDDDVTMPGMVELKEGKSRVGRDSPAEVLLPIPTVSAVHAELEVDGGKLTVTDLESTNGTFIDEKELSARTPTPLALGSEVIFGDTFLAKFILEER